MDLEKKRTVITGSSGFVGSYLVKELEKKKAEIVKVDRTSGKDILDWRSLKNLRNIDIIFHLAAITDVPFSYKNPRLTYETNISGTNNILELARINDVEKFVFPSTYVYGNPVYLPVNEEHPVNPTNPYTRSKVIAEQLIHSYHEDYGIDCVVLRPFNIYGVGQKEHFLISTILNQLNTRKVILKDPIPKRDFVHVEDLLKAMICSLHVSAGFEVVNIGSGESHSVEEVARKIIGYYSKDIELLFTGETRTNEIHDCVADISKAKKVLKWEPRVTLSEGLKAIVNHFKERT